MTGQEVAYIRVSTIEQNTESQRAVLSKIKIDRYFEEKISGKNAKRPELQAMLDYVREGDTVYVKDLSRLARNTKNLLNIVEYLTNKGVRLKSIKENIERNFGMSNPEGYRKALRLMKQAEKFHRPVILFVNTSGAYCGVGAEERGQGEAIARNLMEMAGLTVPILSIFIGEGGSGGALALALADRVWMLDNGMYAVLSPEGFASILWRSPERSSDAAELMKLTAPDLLKNGVIEKIIPEAPEGLAENLEYTTSILKRLLIEELNLLKSLKTEELLQQRYSRFRKYGEFTKEEHLSV